MSITPIAVGIIGTGNIAPAYIKGCRAFDILNLVACADIDMERARAVAAEYKIPKAMTVDEMLADPEIGIVINLTIPAAHAEISLRALEAGKHVYSEKPFATTVADGRKILETAKAKGLRVGCAPDTFMFAPHQTARKLLDEGHIGRPVAATGFMMSRGPEGWHPNPDFFFQFGGGPMLDMGPYYITCLINLLGPATTVTGSARISYPERTAKDGHKIKVEVPTHVTGTLEFASGAVATLAMSFDITGHRLPVMEVYGENGTLAIPDPNGYHPNVVQSYVPGVSDWADQPDPFRPEWARGIGTADMAYGITYGRPHRASGELAFHVLEIMYAFIEATDRGGRVDIQSTVERPAPLPLGLPERQLDQ
jgi:predicted dehydrogenase